MSCDMDGIVLFEWFECCAMSGPFPVWNDGYFVPISVQPVWGDTWTNQKQEQYGHVWIECVTQFKHISTPCPLVPVLEFSNLL